MSDNKPVINTNAPAPPGIEGEGFFAGKLSDIIGMARKFYTAKVFYTLE